MARPTNKSKVTGRQQTDFTINSQSILYVITPLMDNARIKKEIFKLATGILDYVQDMTF